jgi:hypothetical protein
MEIARGVQQEKVCIYFFTRTYGEMIPAEEYIQHMGKILQMIEEEAGGDLSGRDDSEIVVLFEKSGPAKMLTLNF